MESIKDSGYGNGDGSGDGCGSGRGDGSGNGTGSGDGSGDGNGTGENRKIIELNILKNIPRELLPLYMWIWEFDETKLEYEKKLKRENHVP